MANKPKWWLWGVVGSLGLYMIGIVIFVIFAFNQDNDLVTPDYYEADLKYDQRQAQALSAIEARAVPEISIKTTHIEIFFPQFNVGKHSGTIIFYRAQLASMDRKVILELDEEGKIRIPKESVANGKWKLIFNWNNGVSNFFHEEEIWVN